MSFAPFDRNFRITLVRGGKVRGANSIGYTAEALHSVAKANFYSI